MSKEQKRRALLTYSGSARLRSIMWARWRNGSRPGCSTEPDRAEYVLDAMRKAVDLLMPEHEERARELFAQMRWPEGFPRVPSFEKIAGLPCATCGGSGVSGFLFGIRCLDC
jgi:hypothetical protein